MIQDYNFFYNILRHYSNACFPFAYSQLECVGRENIPTDGAVIFAPNHSNAFMDALAVHYVADSPVVFVARADVFRNPIAARLFHFFKIMPIMRIRDGRENLKKNDAVIHTAVDVLRAGVPFGIFCEGTHRMKHSILPLVKGIFRIAIQADEVLDGEMPVYIVPIGIDYGSYVRFRSKLCINVGKAMNVSEFVKKHADKTHPELMMEMRSQLTKRMSELYHCVPDNEDYDSILDLSYLRNREIIKSNNVKSTPYQVMLANRKTVNDIEKLKNENPTKYSDIISMASEFAKERRRLGINDESLYNKISWKKNISRLLGLFFTLPYMAFCSIVNLPITVIVGLIFLGIEDGAMKNSLRYAILMILFPFILLTMTIILSNYLPWFVVVMVIVLAAPANIFVHKYSKEIRLIISDSKLLKSKKLKSLKNTLSTLKF